MQAVMKCRLEQSAILGLSGTRAVNENATLLQSESDTISAVLGRYY